MNNSKQQNGMNTINIKVHLTKLGTINIKVHLTK